MRVILSSNISHYYYAALALERAGYLARYITAVTPTAKFGWISRVVPSYWRAKFKGREMPGIAKEKLVSLWSPEVVARVLERAHLLSTDRANWLQNGLYDLFARPHVAKCDVFHFVSSIGLRSARKAKKFGAVIICDERTEHPDFQRKLLKEEYALLGVPFNPPGMLYDQRIKSEYALADYLVVPSSYAKRTFVDAGFEDKKIFVVPYGFDVSQFTRLPKRDNIFRVIFSGQVIPRKGIKYLLEAFDTLSLEHAELLLVGKVDASMEKLVRFYSEKNPAIKAVGNVPKIELARYYNDASVFALPSLSDAQPLVAFEAMACGLPVITTTNTGTQEIVREGIDGFVVESKSVEALKAKIQFLYEHEGVRMRMGASAHARIQEFTWQKYGERLLRVYHEIATASGIV